MQKLTIREVLTVQGKRGRTEWKESEKENVLFSFSLDGVGEFTRNTTIATHFNPVTDRKSGGHQ